MNFFLFQNVHGGQDLVGQLGQGDTACYKTPRKVGKLVEIPIKAVACGEDFTACITGKVKVFAGDFNLSFEQVELSDLIADVIL